MSARPRADYWPTKGLGHNKLNIFHQIHTGIVRCVSTLL